MHLRHALRALARDRGFTLVAVALLALGIGATTAIFSLVHGVVLAPLDVADPDRLVAVWETTPGKGRDTISAANFRRWREEAASFASLASYGYLSLTLEAAGGRPEQVRGASTTAGFFDTFGAEPLHGRFYSRGWSERRGARPVVLGEELWRRHLAADPAIVGRTVRLDGEPFEVAAVARASFRFPDAAELWVAAPPDDVPELGDLGRPLERRLDSMSHRAYGRLAPGVTVAGARAEMDGLARRLAAEDPERNAGRGVGLAPLHDEVVGEARAPLGLLLAAVGLLLAVASVNVACLMLARTAGRRRELAVRSALGAARGRLVRQLLAEALLLAAAGGVAGALVAGWALEGMVAAVPADVPRLAEVAVHPPVLAFTAAVALGSCLLFGVVPALAGSRVRPAAVLRATRPGAGSHRGLARFVVAEVALATLLLVAAGLLARSYVRLQAVDPGFATERLLTFRLTLPRDRYPEHADRLAFHHRLLAELEAAPEVERAVTALDPPLSGDTWNRNFSVEGRPDPPAHERSRDGFQIVSPGYFETMGIELVAGRTLRASEEGGVVVLNRAIARHYWPGEEPAEVVGRRVTYDDPADPGAEWLTVVGVVEDTRHWGLDREPRREAYVPAAWTSLSFTQVVVKTSVDPLAVVPQVRAALARLDPSRPIADLATMEESLRGALARPRFLLALLATFATSALALAALGVYGVLAYAVGRRRRELGVRAALGARPAGLLAGVVGDALRLGGTGLALGLLAALAAGRLLETLLFGVASADPVTYAGVAVVTLAAVTAAALWPAIEAATMDPAVTLRDE